MSGPLAVGATMLLLTSGAWAQLPYTETFDNENFKDAANTTAEWQATAPGALRLTTPTTLPAVGALSMALEGATGADVDGSAMRTTRAVATGDMDADGDEDILFGNNFDNALYLNNGSGSFSESAGALSGDFTGITTNTRSVAVGDLNGDGFLDIVFANFDNAVPSIALFNDPANPGTFAQAITLGDATDQGDSVAIGDVDNDGDLDVVLGLRRNVPIVYRNDGPGAAPNTVNFTAVPTNATGVTADFYWARGVLLGDLDNDDDLDLVAVTRDRRDGGANPQDSEAIYTYINDGAGNFAAPQQAGFLEFALSSPDPASLGDIDGDGLLDLVIASDQTGDQPPLGRVRPSRIYLNSGNPADVFGAGADLGSGDATNQETAMVADVNRDGNLDIVVAVLDDVNDVFQPDVIYINDGAGNFPAMGTVIAPADGRSSKSLAMADLDGDSDLDVVFAMDDGTNRFYLNAGTPGAASAQLVARAQSLPIDGGVAFPSEVIVNPTDNNTTANQVFTYRVSNDGGATWLVARPGVPVSFPGANVDLRWRVDLSSKSPALTPELDTLEIVAVNNAPTITLVGDNPLDVPFGGPFTDPGATATDAEDGDLTGSIVVDTSLLDLNTPGPSTVTYSVTDSGGESASVDRTVNVLANTPPVITLSGANPLDVALGGPFIDPGATATDAEDGDLTGSITVDTSSLDVNTIGQSTVTYSVTDSGGATVSVDRTVNVVDMNTAPVITLNGANPLNVPLGDLSFTDPGATATDAEDGDLTGSIAVDNGGFDVNTLGLYTFTYSVVDSGGLTASVNRTVNVVDSPPGNTAPVITLNGANPLNLTVGSAFVDPGATATDAEDGDLTGSIVVDDSQVDTSTVGSYSVSYSVTDSGGLTATASRTVAVNAVDPQAPQIELNGANPLQWTVGTAFVDPGATATNAAGDSVAVTSDAATAVNVAQVGTYTVTYTATDAGLTSTASRTVNVVQPVGSGGGGSSANGPLTLLLLGLAGFFGRRARRQRL